MQDGKEQELENCRNQLKSGKIRSKLILLT
jgi:hypothetical protein